jgi:hypothetical protein
MVRAGAIGAKAASHYGSGCKKNDAAPAPQHFFLFKTYFTSRSKPISVPNADPFRIRTGSGSDANLHPIRI